ncbi:MAG: PAS domain S-box protein [Nitrosopumilus sp.]|uniref:PAS domain-containing protein n=1 Tax=Nitrosopumilus sp. TaxID=2024843 RepID=UPI00247D92BE|nr:PAS domain S-box protein [Nitrosopumilus sp.]MCV0392044.1 PAS domain S-box protein [Nitrosopumilus sp.]
MIGLVTCSIFVLFAYYTILINVSEVDKDKTRITDLIKTEISIQNRDRHVFADMTNAFYAASEHITEKEFETFVSYIISDITELRNIAVMQDEQIINSYPIKNILLNTTDNSFDMVMVDQRPTILIKHTESADDVTVLLFIDPDRFISFPDILHDPYKVEILFNDNTIYYHTSSNDDLYFTDNEFENTLTIYENISTSEYDDTPQIMTIRIWEGGFVNYFHVPVGIVLSGVVMSVLTSFLAYQNTQTKTKLQEKNKELSYYNHTLEENKKHMKQLQSRLLESDEKHRNLFELSPLGIFVLDLNGYFTSCNGKAVEIFGYDKNDMIGKHFTLLVAEHDIDKQSKLFAKVLSDGIIMEKPVLCKMKNGTEFQMIVNASAMKDNNAKISGVIAVLYYSNMHEELQTSLLSS